MTVSQQAQMLMANFWQNACDKSETCGENVNGETQEAAKALLHGSGRQGKYREHIYALNILSLRCLLKMDTTPVFVETK